MEKGLERVQLKRKTKRALFFWCMAALPLLQFLIFYVYVNFNNVILAFQHYELNENFTFDVSFTFGNFATAWNTVAEKPYLITNSLVKFVVLMLIQYPLALIFSNYIYKKWPGSGFFKTVLFMPQLISGLIYGLLFKYIVSDVYVALDPTAITGLLDLNNLATARTTVLVISCLMGFGVNVLLFSGSMSGINESIVESAQLDGVNNLQEFLYITLPMTWPTVVQLVVVSVSAIFTDQMNLMTFYGDKAYELSTLGYFMYFQAAWSDVIPKGTFLSYGTLSALSLMITAVVFPLTLIVRKLMTKYGPSVD